MTYKATTDEWRKVMDWFEGKIGIAPKVYAVRRYEELKTENPGMGDGQIKSEITGSLEKIIALPNDARQRVWAKYMTVPGINDKT